MYLRLGSVEDRGHEVHIRMMDRKVQNASSHFFTKYHRVTPCLVVVYALWLLHLQCLPRSYWLSAACSRAVPRGRSQLSNYQDDSHQLLDTTEVAVGCAVVRGAYCQTLADSLVHLRRRRECVVEGQIEAKSK